MCAETIWGSSGCNQFQNLCLSSILMLGAYGWTSLSTGHVCLFILVYSVYKTSILHGMVLNCVYLDSYYFILFDYTEDIYTWSNIPIKMQHIYTYFKTIKLEAKANKIFIETPKMNVPHRPTWTHIVMAMICCSLLNMKKFQLLDFLWKRLFWLWWRSYHNGFLLVKL